MLIPGKIFFIENDLESIRETIESFWQVGEGVVCSREIPQEDKCPSNVRLVVLDLVLGEDGEIQDTDYQQAALAVRRIEEKTGFFLVAPWSVHITRENKDEVIANLRTAYKEQTGTELSERILKAFGKHEITKEQLVQEIEKWITENPEAGLVFEWEKSVENARDEATSTLMNMGGVRTTLKAVEKERGRPAVSREIFTLFGKLLSRYSLIRLDESKMDLLVNGVLKRREVGGASLLEWYPKVRYHEAYYHVTKTEPLWTGDVLKTNLSVPEKEYAVIITPACDFAQKRFDSIKVAFATKIETIREYDVDSASVPAVVKKLGQTKQGKWKTRKEIIGLIGGGTRLPARFYLLYFLYSSLNSADYFHLLVDFSAIESRSSSVSGGIAKLPRNWERICRLGSPYLEDLMQKYGAFSARVGTPDIPPDVIKKEKRRLET